MSMQTNKEIRKTVRRTTEHKQSLENGSRILAERCNVIRRSDEYKKSMSNAFKLAAAEMDKIR
ncbi:hypothetical protein [Providencia stuartii]|uniref:hypothetical protein n=1 Tax=Providencia stuartii TaxID=588 RepID=UPI00300D04F0